ncbi:hypothetical protein [Rehaibacterium terrae]|jgi:hypothetical protein|uniref:Uncharacterized protein n=1 Tax=Rehaibacterium terrae TaxID=1341696 RepID=A0A7W7Y0Y5_9GAMM|nr:hypothetical protein [Rehaibacterium terrae]MBB5015853.1 hypothetical protein [Rehaibacterium terrae]
MRFRLPALLLATLLPAATPAADGLLHERWSLAFGGYGNRLGLDGRIDGNTDVRGTPFDFDDSFGFDRHERLRMAELTLAPTQDHELRLRGFRDRRRHDTTLTEELVFSGVVFPVDADVRGRFGLDVLDLDYTWWRWRQATRASGLVLGLTRLRAGIDLDGEARNDGGPPEPLRADYARHLYAPSLGLAFKAAPGERWRYRLDAGAMRLRHAGIHGTILEASAAAEYFPAHRLGIGLRYTWTRLEAEGRRGDTLRGELDLDYAGWQLYLRLRS